MTRSEILTFRSTAPGFFYGGYEMFYEKAVEGYRKFWVERCEAVSSMDEKDLPPPGMPIVPMVIHILLSDNTGILADVYIESPNHKEVIANSIRGFVQKDNFSEEISGTKAVKAVAVIVCMETQVRAFSTNGLSEAEIKAKIKNRDKETTIESWTALSFIVSRAEAPPGEPKEFSLTYKAERSGETVELPGDPTTQAPSTIGEMWADLFMRSLETDAIAYFSPAKAAEYVSRMIKEGLEKIDQIKRVEPLSEEARKAMLDDLDDHIKKFKEKEGQ